MLLLHVDAFTDRPFRGNPAAVCLLDRERDDTWMAGVSAEMNLSETAYLLRAKDGFNLRWFTPAVEVALCGHATLASAHVLWQEKLLGTGEQARFHTKSGLLTATQTDGLIYLDFPATPVSDAEAPAALLESLGVSPRYAGRSKFDYLIEVESEEIVRNMKPDFARLRQVGVRGVMVTSRSSEYDFVSRFFAPGSGIDEDPVTGSAHCALGPYWARHLGRTDFRAYQASSRGGVMQVKVRGERVLLGGNAVTVSRGELRI